jgi:glycosyltransferase involved in cell wall biosynthesis
MIVKNEEANIGCAIQSFLPFADEIVVNDTGSTDKTVEIVKSFPKTVLITSEWINDFAHSRNLSIEHATCSWILWMDADDYVPPDQVESFNKLKRTALDKMISFTVCNTEEDGKPTGVRFMQARMFPNHPKIRFTGRIHENALEAASDLGLQVMNTGVIIWHTGYETLEIRQKKARRNLELQLEDQEQKNRIEGLIELGDSYSVLDDYEKAIDYYEQATKFKCPPEKLDLKMSAMNKLGRYLYLTKKYEDAKKIYNDCLEQFPKNEESYYGLAFTFLSEDKIEESIPYFRKLLNVKMNVSSGGSNYFRMKMDALKNISVYEFRKGNFKLSRNYAELMLKEDPDSKDAAALIEQANSGLLNAKDKRPLLSLCMIVKNEEDNIGECLKSVHGLADEIIVTDTGSSDKTVEIAKSFNAKIENFEWSKDFSAARNYSVSKAGSRWIIWLDADDRVPQKTVIELRRKLSQESPNKVFSLVVCNSTDSGGIGIKFSQIRVFPNKEQIKFEGRIHEQIIPSIRKLGLPEVKLDLEILHTGYEDPASLKEKQLRNLEIFREQFPGEKGMNSLDMFHYGTSYEIIGDYENALKWMRESLSCAKKQRYDELLVLIPNDIARILENKGSLQEALESIELSLKENPQYEPAISRKAQILNKLGLQEEAVKCFGYCTSLIPKPSFLPSNETAACIEALKFLAQYWKDAEQTPLAIDILKTLKNFMLGAAHNPLALAEMYINNDKPKEALDNLEFIRKELGGKPEFAFLYGQALALTGDAQNAVKTVSKAREKFPENTDIANLAKAMGI